MPVQALVGWRSGAILQLDCRPPDEAAAAFTENAVDDAAGRIQQTLQLLAQVCSAVPCHCCLALQAQVAQLSKLPCSCHRERI